MAKVMLVEDDNNLREIYEARLQAEGYEIVSAKDGEEALVVAKAEKPDLIISDVMMPKISGFEMLDILRNTDGLKDVKVIMLTALGQSDDQQRADKLGADRYLVKSQVTLEDIVDVAHKLLGEGTSAAPTSGAPAPAAQATPVAPAPAAEPAAQNIAVTEPPAETPTTPPPAEPAAEEQSSVDAKIEDFVAGATSDATAAPAPAAVTPTPDPAAAATTKADDQVIASAVDNLVNDTPPADSTPAKADEEPAGRKVITPIDADPKPDLNSLLAAEDAKEKTPAPAEKPKDAKAEDKPVDPNSIAL